MDFAPTKCKTMCVSTKTRNNIPYLYHRKGLALDSVKEVRYLGITITRNTRRANQILGLLRKNLYFCMHDKHLNIPYAKTNVHIRVKFFVQGNWTLEQFAKLLDFKQWQHRGIRGQTQRDVIFHPCMRCANEYCIVRTNTLKWKWSLINLLN